MPKFYRQNRKRIDPRYFLQETSIRSLDEGLLNWLKKKWTGFTREERWDIASLAGPLARSRGDHDSVPWDEIIFHSVPEGPSQIEKIKDRYLNDEKFQKAVQSAAEEYISKGKISWPTKKPRFLEPEMERIRNRYKNIDDKIRQAEIPRGLKY